MLAAVRIRLLPLCTAVLAVVGFAGAADAGWVTIKNDTNQVIVVQCGMETNGQMKRCRPVRLLPGEAVREFRAPRTLMVEVFEGQNPIKLLHTGNLAIKPENQAFSVSTDGRTVSITLAPSR
ncbi:MAG: hypothetical protein JWO38_6490 [Gemmataceae bacterium]|nr:hypothetical protein [Gemmataceae bacterium]